MAHNDSDNPPCLYINTEEDIMDVDSLNVDDNHTNFSMDDGTDNTKYDDVDRMLANESNTIVCSARHGRRLIQCANCTTRFAHSPHRFNRRVRRLMDYSDEAATTFSLACLPYEAYWDTDFFPALLQAQRSPLTVRILGEIRNITFTSSIVELQIETARVGDHHIVVELYNMCPSPPRTRYDPVPCSNAYDLQEPIRRSYACRQILLRPPHVRLR